MLQSTYLEVFKVSSSPKGMSEARNCSQNVLKVFEKSIKWRYNEKVIKDYVINSGHRTVWINFEGFLNFLRYRQNKRFKEVG